MTDDEIVPVPPMSSIFFVSILYPFYLLYYMPKVLRTQKHEGQRRKAQFFTILSHPTSS
jgi:hypothetical protein